MWWALNLRARQPAATRAFPPASALPRAVPGDDPAALLNALAAAGLGARVGLICLGALRMIRAAATPAAGHSRVQTTIAASGTKAALASSCDRCDFVCVGDAACVCSVPPAQTAIATATARSTGCWLLRDRNRPRHEIPVPHFRSSHVILSRLRRRQQRASHTSVLPISPCP